MNIQIQNYSDKYADQLAVLCEEFQDYLVALDPEKRLRRTEEYGKWSVGRKVKKSEDGKSAFYIALDDNQVAGFVFGSVDPTPPEAAYYSTYPAAQGTVEELYVAENYRSKGIAGMLMNKIEDYLKGNGCKYINLGVFAFNANARKMYEHLGYRVRVVSMTKKLDK